MVPEKDLFINSVLTDPSAYLRRALLIQKCRKDTISTLVIKQKDVCSICKKSLVNEAGLVNLENNVRSWDSPNELSYHEDQSTFEIPNLSSIKGTDWLKPSQIDHIVPLVLAGNSLKLKSVLNNLDNLQLVHTACHLDKSKEELRTLMREYRKRRKLILPHKLVMYTKKQLLQAHNMVVLQLYKDKYLESYKQSIINKLVYIIKKSI